MGSPPRMKEPLLPPPVASLVDPQILDARNRERQKRKARYGQRQSLLTSQRGARNSANLSMPSLLNNAPATGLR
jgi:hypothetical protein